MRVFKHRCGQTERGYGRLRLHCREGRPETAIKRRARRQQQYIQLKITQGEKCAQLGKRIPEFGQIRSRRSSKQFRIAAVACKLTVDALQFAPQGARLVHLRVSGNCLRTLPLLILNRRIAQERRQRLAAFHFERFEIQRLGRRRFAGEGLMILAKNHALTPTCGSHWP